MKMGETAKSWALKYLRMTGVIGNNDQLDESGFEFPVLLQV